MTPARFVDKSGFAFDAPGAASTAAATTRATALARLRAIRAFDPRTARQIADAAGVASADPANVLDGDGLPTDWELRRYCELYRIKVKIRDLGRKAADPADYAGTAAGRDGEGGADAPAADAATAPPAPSRDRPTPSNEESGPTDGSRVATAQAAGPAPVPASPAPETVPDSVPGAEAEDLRRRLAEADAEILDCNRRILEAAAATRAERGRAEGAAALATAAEARAARAEAALVAISRALR